MRRYADGRPAQDASGRPLRYDAGGDAHAMNLYGYVVSASGPADSLSEKLVRFGKATLNERTKIAQAVYDKVAEAAEVYMDNGYSAVTVAKIAQKACLEALEFKAYEAGLLGDPREDVSNGQDGVRCQ